MSFIYLTIKVFLDQILNKLNNEKNIFILKEVNSFSSKKKYTINNFL